MRKTNYKGKCVKKSVGKCRDVCRTYDAVQLSALDHFEEDESIREFLCNVPLEAPDLEEYMTDFVCTKTDGTLMVRECVFRKMLHRPTTMTLLDASRMYWLRKGVSDWGLFIDAEK